jgi:hypothetical protein
MKCTKCGAVEPDNEFSYLWDAKKFICAECVEKANAEQKAANEEYERTTPEEHKHNPNIIFPQ